MKYFNHFSWLVIMVLSTHFSFAQQELPLYPNGIPDALPHHIKERMVKRPDGNVFAFRVVNPTLTVFKAVSKKPTSAVIICPGGGYGLLSMRFEGTDIAQWFAKNGITAFVLKYRLPNDTTMKDKRFGPMMDLQQAMLQLRTRAQEWNIHTDKIGVLGFSAGGHLATTLMTHYNDVKINNPTGVSLAPNFMLLAYPVSTFGKNTHGGTRQNLVGDDTSLITYFSAEKNIQSNTAPTFIMHAQDDPAVPIAEHSLALYTALVEKKVKAELHVFQSGGHGFGATNPSTKKSWLPLALDWLRLNGF